MAPGSLTGAVVSADGNYGENGFFQFGRQVCYGRCLSGATLDVAMAGQFDASKDIVSSDSIVKLPFSFPEVVDNLRLERYEHGLITGREMFAGSELLHKLYYLVRGALPVPLRRRLQKAYFSDWKALLFPSWPVDFTVDALHRAILRLLMKVSGVRKLPFIWFWPEGASSCLIMTHDVE